MQAVSCIVWPASQASKGKGEGKGRILYGATYMVDQEQRALTISEVAVNWQEPMVLQRKCGHPLPVLTDIGPAVAASKHECRGYPMFIIVTQNLFMRDRVERLLEVHEAHKRGC